MQQVCEEEELSVLLTFLGADLAAGSKERRDGGVHDSVSEIVENGAVDEAVYAAEEPYCLR